jgi:hypothetical protein
MTRDEWANPFVPCPFLAGNVLGRRHIHSQNQKEECRLFGACPKYPGSRPGVVERHPVFRQRSGRGASKTDFVRKVEISAVKRYLDHDVLHRVALGLDPDKILGPNAKCILLPVHIRHGHQSIRAWTYLDKLDFSGGVPPYRTPRSGRRPERNAMVPDVTDTYCNGFDSDWNGRSGKDGKCPKLLE